MLGFQFTPFLTQFHDAYFLDMKEKPDFGHKSLGAQYCQGFVDSDGLWNNGFLCPGIVTFNETVEYCCGTERHRYCCVEENGVLGGAGNGYGGKGRHGAVVQESNTFEKILPVVLIGAAIALLIAMIICILLVCYCYEYCPLYKRRTKKCHKEFVYYDGEAATCNRELVPRKQSQDKADSAIPMTSCRVENEESTKPLTARQNGCLQQHHYHQCKLAPSTSNQHTRHMPDNCKKVHKDVKHKSTNTNNTGIYSKSQVNIRKDNSNTKTNMKLNIDPGPQFQKLQCTSNTTDEQDKYGSTASKNSKFAAFLSVMGLRSSNPAAPVQHSKACGLNPGERDSGCFVTSSEFDSHLCLCDNTDSNSQEENRDPSSSGMRRNSNSTDNDRFDNGINMESENEADGEGNIYEEIPQDREL